MELPLARGGGPGGRCSLEPPGLSSLVTASSLAFGSAAVCVGDVSLGLCWVTSIFQMLTSCLSLCPRVPLVSAAAPSSDEPESCQKLSAHRWGGGVAKIRTFVHRFCTGSKLGAFLVMAVLFCYFPDVSCQMPQQDSWSLHVSHSYT